MGKLRIFLVGVLILLFFGCPVRSIFPLFGDKDMVFMPGLVGTWANTEKNTLGTTEQNTLSIKKAGEQNYYLLEFPVGKDGDQAETNTYYAYLGRLGDFWFLDFYRQIRQDENYDLIPTDLFFRLWLEGDTLRLAALEGDWLDEMIGKKKISISRLLLEDEIILTAATLELQQLVRRFAEDRGAFPDPATYVRLK
jgi:hypothetical protein